MPDRRAARHLGWLALFAVAASGCGGPKGKPPPDRSSMVLVPEGEFVMGRDDGAADERPAHRVWLDTFYIDRLEVTNAQFKAFCDATQRVYPNAPSWDADYFTSKPDYPVIDITQDQAGAYCAWAGKRLPTEAEWEKAARGTDGRLYPWGNTWEEGRGNFGGVPGLRKIGPVGQHPSGASPYGALDMAGNVWEWVADWYDATYYARSPKRNPPGPAGHTSGRVVRGGGWSSPPPDGIVTNRDVQPNSSTVHHLGCRCAWSPR